MKTDKRIPILLLMVLLMNFLNSCCTKKQCFGPTPVIYFYNFNAKDLDTILVFTYSKNTNFTSPIDSEIAYGEFSSDSSYAFASSGELALDFDYKVSVVHTSQSFTLSDFGTEKEGCNTCFPFRPKSDYFTVLKSYTLNGQQRFGQIKIYH